MPQIEMYTRTYCPFCMRAKALMQDKGVAYQEINLDEEPGRRAEMIQRAEGRSTVPQTFVDGRGLGGCDDLFELDRNGELDEILAGNA